MKTTTKTCPKCHKEFIVPSWRKTQKYCSHKCANTGENAPHWKGGLITLVCPTCGKEFQVRQHRKDEAIFCSRSCNTSSKTGEHAHNWKGGPIDTECAYCGKAIHVTRSRANGRRYCSTECQHSYLREHSAKKDPLPKKVREDLWIADEDERLYALYPEAPLTTLMSAFPNRSRSALWSRASKLGIVRVIEEGRPKQGQYLTCPVCGKVKYHPKSRIEDPGRGSYCSQECWVKAHTGENAPNWRDGKSNEPYPLEFNEKFKKMIRERDNYTCALCGEFGNSVHHINYKKHDIDPLNCITLCRPCHSKTSYNRSYWQEKLESLVLYLSPAPTERQSEQSPACAAG